MTRKTRIEQKLQQSLNPEHLVVIDDSAKHAGHAGARPEGETHFHIEIKATALVGIPRIKQHRAIHSAVEEEFTKGLHALSISII
jgi:BolA family transcriptional regulator, general stress-responsive regulator